MTYKPTMKEQNGLIVEIRVIYALILREIHTIYGDSKIGYLWAIFQSLIGISFFWAIRTFMGFHPPHGLSIVAFLLSGFLPWFIFSQTLLKCMTAVAGNHALLTFPQVTSLDLMLSRMIVIWVTQVLSGIIIIIIAYLIHQHVVITNFGGVLSCLFLAPLLGLGFGTVLGSLAFYWSPVTKIVPIILRILFYTSGIFFSVNRLPYFVQEYLLYNPMMHLIEFLRCSLSTPYVTVKYDVMYLVTWVCVMLFFGLLFERYLRGRVKNII